MKTLLASIIICLYFKGFCQEAGFIKFDTLTFDSREPSWNVVGLTGFKGNYLKGKFYYNGKDRHGIHLFNTGADTLILGDFRTVNLFDFRNNSIEFWKTDHKKEKIDYRDAKITDLQLIDETIIHDSIVSTKFVAYYYEIQKAFFNAINFDGFFTSDTEFVQMLHFNNCSFKGSFKLLTRSLPDTIRFMKTNLRELEGEIDLAVEYPSPDERHYISIVGTDVTKININYKYFKLFFDPDHYGRTLSFDEKASVYQDMLADFNSKGAIESYEKLSKEFKEFKYTDGGKWYGIVLNWTDANWWDYGYNKFLILRNAFFLYILFFLINIFLYKSLVEDVYVLEKFAEKNRQQSRKYLDRPVQRLLVKIPYIFLYTGYIFWGWKLDMHAISVNRIGLFSYILFQYLVGIVCLAYIANLIITR